MTVRAWRHSIPLAVLAGALSLAAGAGSARANVLPTIYVTYTMNCTFAITSDSGSAVTAIAPGTYQVEVTTPLPFGAVDLTGDDPSDFTACQGAASFQLSGPGVSLSTTLADGDGDYAVFSETFAPGSTYTALDNNQPAATTVSFTTLASGAPVAPPSTGEVAAPASATASSDLVGSSNASAASGPAFEGTLEGSVSAAGKLTLTFKGRSVTTLAAGRYTVTVSNRDKRDGFTLQGLDRTGITVARVGHLGTATASVDLTAGQWFYYPTFVGKKTYFIVTT